MSTPDDITEQAWAVRRHIFASGRPPTVETTAADLGLPVEDVRAAYDWLNAKHALYLSPGTHDVRIANPFSGVPTDYLVRANGRDYTANCAWDALGVPAALGADAEITATLPDGAGEATL